MKTKQKQEKQESPAFKIVSFVDYGPDIVNNVFGDYDKLGTVSYRDGRRTFFLASSPRKVVLQISEREFVECMTSKFFQDAVVIDSWLNLVP